MLMTNKQACQAGAARFSVVGAVGLSQKAVFVLQMSAPVRWDQIRS
jgi:hypothetical protein